MGWWKASKSMEVLKLQRLYLLNMDNTLWSHALKMFSGSFIYFVFFFTYFFLYIKRRTYISQIFSSQNYKQRELWENEWKGICLRFEVFIYIYFLELNKNYFFLLKIINVIIFLKKSLRWMKLFLFWKFIQV